MPMSLVRSRWLSYVLTRLHPAGCHEARRGRPAVLFALAALLTFGSGCGALAAAANPKLAWAISDPAPMTVVVRRADAAAKTATEVDRLLGATPANKDSDWMAKTAPATADASKQMKDLSALPLYADSKARVVPSEVWVRTLPLVTSKKGTYPNLFAAIDKDLGEKYTAIMQKKLEIAGLRALIAAEEQARDEKGIGEAEKDGRSATQPGQRLNEHDGRVKEIEKMADGSEAEVEPLQKDFIRATRDGAAKCTADVREKVGVAVVNLRQAVDDAETANGAAVIRYPMAAPGMLSSIKDMVPVFVADIIQEKTGKRPDLKNLKPEVKLDGTNVSLTLAGLDAADLGKIKMAALTTETIARTQSWVVHALGLLGTIASTKEVLSFEEKVLDAMIDGFTAGGWKAQAAATIPLAGAIATAPQK